MAKDVQIKYLNILLISRLSPSLVTGRVLQVFCEKGDIADCHNRLKGIKKARIKGLYG
jgi:hypothetical protein